MKVFIVDDESHAILRMKHLAGSFPELEVVGEARTAEDAIYKILKLKPDVVFLDVEIGNTTGFDVIARVAVSGYRPKYIIVSGYSQYAIAAIRSKVDDYLLKPVDLEEFKASLERVNGSIKLKALPIDLAYSINLTKREKMVLAGMLAGKASKEMAGEMFISPHTVDTFRRKVLKKLGVRNTVELLGKIRL